jgi:CBS domain-containing protein
VTVEAILDNKGREVVTIASDATLEQVAKRLIEHRIGALVVTAPNASERMVGLISERDVVRLAAEFGTSALKLPVAAAMTSRVLTCKPSDSIDGVMGLITRERVRHLPVFDGDKLVGLISIGDVVKFRLNEQDQEIGMWRELFTAR